MLYPIQLVTNSQLSRSMVLDTHSWDKELRNKWNQSYSFQMRLFEYIYMADVKVSNLTRRLLVEFVSGTTG